MIRNLTMTAQHSLEPITLAEAKAHLRVTSSADNTYIESLIKVAREKVEDDTGRAYVQADYEVLMTGFCSDGIKLPRSPIIEVAEIRYRDPDAAWQEMDLDDVTIDGGVPAEIHADTWPDTYKNGAVVGIEYRAGLEGTGTSPDIDISAKVPLKIKQAMLLIIAHLYDNRAAASALELKYLPFGYEALIASERVYGV